MIWSGGNAALRHNTIADNQGEAGVRVGWGSLTLTNTIISGHTYGIRTEGANVTADHTLWYSNTLNTAAYGGINITSTHDFDGDPVFVGGSDIFDAYHIGADSPAIDAGVDTGLTTDIDGEGRAPDIGADEYPYVLNLTPDHRITAEAGTVVAYTHVLRNSGSVTDTVSLSALSSQGWEIQVEPLTATLGSGQAISVSLIISVPTGVEAIADTTTVSAVSTGDLVIRSVHKTFLW